MRGRNTAVSVLGLVLIAWFLQFGSGEALAEGDGLNKAYSAGRVGEWRLLFDGKTTAGWRGFKQSGFPSKGWIIEDGCLKHCLHGGGGDIVTEETFDEFDLEFEWKLSPGSNSGVKYFVLE
ncbi:MAG: 3-keto-disaccharide hydrolase, partial [Verrucomicrobiia bacterium]